MTFDDITLILKTYNRKKILKQTLDAYPDMPMIIFNDCSTDGTDKYLYHRYKDNTNVIIVNNAENKQMGYGWNKGIIMAQTEYVWQVDDDIIHLEQAFDFVLKSLEATKKLDCLIGFYCYKWQRWRDHYHDKVYVTRNAKDIKINGVRMKLGDINTASMFGRKAVFQKVGELKTSWGSDREFITRAYENEVFMCGVHKWTGYVRNIGQDKTMQEIGRMKAGGQRNLERWKEHDEKTILAKRRKVKGFFKWLDEGI